MRFPANQEKSDFLKEVEEFCSNETQSLETAALVNPKRYTDWEGTWRLPNDLSELLVLAIWSWYTDDDCTCVLRDQIREKALQNEDLYVLRFVTTTKSVMEEFLLTTTLWHSRDFFGNMLCSKMIKVLSSKVKIRWKSTKKPTRTVRRRGYKDKGSLRSDVSPNKFIDCTKEMLELYDYRESLNDTELFLRAFLGEE